MSKIGSITLAAALAWLPLITFGVRAETADWALVAEASNFGVLLDRASVRRDDIESSAIVMRNFIENKTTPGGRPYRSSVSVEAFDCGGKKTRLIARNFYSGERGAGEVVETFATTTATWVNLPSESVGFSLLKFECKIAATTPVSPSGMAAAQRIPSTISTNDGASESPDIKQPAMENSGKPTDERNPAPPAS